MTKTTQKKILEDYFGKKKYNITKVDFNQLFVDVYNEKTIGIDEIKENEIFFFPQASRFGLNSDIVSHFKGKEIFSVRKTRPTLIVIPEKKTQRNKYEIYEHSKENGLFYDFMKKEGKVSRYIYDSEFKNIFIPQNNRRMTDEEIENVVLWMKDTKNGFKKMAQLFMFENFNPNVIDDQLLYLFSKKMRYSDFFYNVNKKNAAWKYIFDENNPFVKN